MELNVIEFSILAEQLNQTSIQGQRIVCAECLIDGDVSGDTLSEFWETRAKFISESYKATHDEYFTKVVFAFDAIMNLPEDAEVNLWFENDLFCQVNMWSVLALLSERPPKALYRVFPIIDNPADQWKGFGASDTQMLEKAYEARVLVSQEDIHLGASLWIAYKRGELETLKELSRQPFWAYQQLQDVVQAHIDRFPGHHRPGRPEKTIRQLIEQTSTEFDIVFSEFSKHHGIYGFGDTQVRAMYEKIMSRE